MSRIVSALSKTTGDKIASIEMMDAEEEYYRIHSGGSGKHISERDGDFEDGGEIMIAFWDDERDEPYITLLRNIGTINQHGIAYDGCAWLPENVFNTTSSYCIFNERQQLAIIRKTYFNRHSSTAYIFKVFYA